MVFPSASSSWWWWWKWKMSKSIHVRPRTSTFRNLYSCRISLFLWRFWIFRSVFCWLTPTNDALFSLFHPCWCLCFVPSISIHFAILPILSLCWFIHAPHPPLRFLFSISSSTLLHRHCHTLCLLLTDLSPFRPLNPKNPCLSFSVSPCQCFYVGMKRSISLKQRINSLDKTSGRGDTERERCKGIYMNMYIHRLFIPIIVSKSEEEIFFSHRKISQKNEPP